MRAAAHRQRNFSTLGYPCDLGVTFICKAEWPFGPSAVPLQACINCICHSVQSSLECCRCLQSSFATLGCISMFMRCHSSFSVGGKQLMGMRFVRYVCDGRYLRRFQPRLLCLLQRQKLLQQRPRQTPKQLLRQLQRQLRPWQPSLSSDARC